MNDMSSAIVPKSDQWNADDFLAGPKTFQIESVSISPGQDQPVSIKLVGETRVWRPCKSMSRCLVSCWGPDAKSYIGRSLTLYCDPTVTWGGLAIGGIRLSHLSDIDRKAVLALTATRGNKKPYTVLPLVVPQSAPTPDPAKLRAEAYEASKSGTAALTEFWGTLGKDARLAIRDDMAEFKAQAGLVDAASREPGEEG